jgi:hypothetical protein
MEIKNNFDIDHLDNYIIISVKLPRDENWHVFKFKQRGEGSRPSKKILLIRLVIKAKFAQADTHQHDIRTRR